MHNLFKIFAISLTSLIVATTAVAETSKIKTVQALDDTAINAACAADPAHKATSAVTCAAFELDMEFYSTLTVEVDYTYSAATEIQIIVETSAVGSTGPWAVAQLNADTATAPDVTLSNGGNLAVTTGAANQTFSFTLVDVASKYIRIRITSTSGDASDLVDVYVARR